MNFRSLTDLQSVLAAKSHVFRDFDLIVGVPRSGLLAANLLCLHFNKPMSDLDGFVAGRMLASGKTKPGQKKIRSMADVKTVLILDDSIANGFAMREAREMTAHLSERFEMTYAAVYGNARTHPQADIIFETVAQPRMFQWNFIHTAWLEKACVDIDGVLCADPTAVENDDGPLYEQFLLNAPTLHLPSRKLAHLVTNRLEAYRPQTEAWLAQQGIVFDRLHMNDAESAAARRQQPPGAFKARVYRALDATLFIESSDEQADEIARLSGKPVLSVETWRMCTPGGVRAALRTKSEEAQQRGVFFFKATKIRFKRAISRLIGPQAVSKLKAWKHARRSIGE